MGRKVNQKRGKGANVSDQSTTTQFISPNLTKSAEQFDTGRNMFLQHVNQNLNDKLAIERLNKTNSWEYI